MTRSNTDAHNHSRQQRAVLLATDQENSVLNEIGSGRINCISYSAYGYQSAKQDVVSCLGFNGEMREAFHWYILGNGYRVFNPRLMRFHSPDSWSPFGAGGLNAYVYCGGDPRNFADPMGHMRRIKSLFSRSRSPSPPPTLPRVAVTPNEYVLLPTTAPSTTQILSNSGAPPLPPRNNRSARPDLSSPNIPSVQPDPPTPRTPSVSQRSNGFVVERSAPQNPRSSETTRVRPSEITVRQDRSTDPNVPPLPPRRIISEHSYRQYSISRNLDGTWSQKSKEVTDIRALRQGQ